MPPIIEIIRPRLQHSASVLARHKKVFWAAGIIVLTALVSFSALAYYQQTHRAVCSSSDCITTATYAPTPTPATPVPTPKTVAALLDGTPVERGSENIHPLAVMIENHPDARPQSGLSQASLVYEAIAEGGITRFMAVFRDPRQAIKVGPVRSARTYYVDFATELNAFYAHVGGNADALDQIRATGVLDLDQFSLGSAAYHREPRNVAIEHTMFSSTELLWNYATNQMHWSQTGSFSPWTFQEDLVKEKRPASQSVSINFSSTSYLVDWAYDPATNLYNRSMAGAPHKDANTGTQITAKNIVLETVLRQPTVTRSNEQGWIYTTKGSGPAVIYQNGGKIEGTWKKDGTNRTRYYDAAGKEIAFVAGTTWVEIIHPDTPVQ